jgi:hypothetical protein
MSEKGLPVLPSLLSGAVERNHLREVLQSNFSSRENRRPCIFISPNPKGLSPLLTKWAIALRISGPRELLMTWTEIHQYRSTWIECESHEPHHRGKPNMNTLGYSLNSEKSREVSYIWIWVGLLEQIVARPGHTGSIRALFFSQMVQAALCTLRRLESTHCLDKQMH